ncbi:MAG TPA: hypothetical protein VFU68_00660, partial [Terracidiphilus sp.]|nr:hypothetical protein [Terracidiphilus sp.]
MNCTRSMKTLALASLGALACSAWGQQAHPVTRADYDRALNLQKQYDSLVVDLPDTPVWLKDGNRFVYRKSVQGGHEFMEYDAASKTKKPAFDHAKLAAALFAASGEQVTALTLPFARFRFLDGESAMAFEAGDTAWKCDLKTWKCEGHPVFSGD